MESEEKSEGEWPYNYVNGVIAGFIESGLETAKLLASRTPHKDGQRYFWDLATAWQRALDGWHTWRMNNDE
jgi:hypothetical protein